MKRVKLFSLLAAISALSFVACGNDVPPAQDDEDASSESKQEQQKETDSDKPVDVKNASLATAYEANFVYDLSEIVPSQYYDISQFFNDPAGKIADEVVNAAMTKVSENSTISGLITAAKFIGIDAEKILKDAVKNALTEYVADEETQGKLKPAGEAMDALSNLIKNFAVVSNMTVAVDGSSYKVNEAWDSITYEWAYGCDSASEDCSHIIKVAEMGLADGSNLNSEYGMSLDATNNVVKFENRNFTMAYGTIIKYVYDHVVVSAITENPEDIGSKALLAYLIDCQDLVDGLDMKDGTKDEKWNVKYKEDGSTIPVPTSIVKSACDMGITAGGNYLDGYITKLVDLGTATINSNGSFTPANADSNKVIKTLKDAQITGTLTVQNPANNASTGSMPLKATGSAQAK